MRAVVTKRMADYVEPPLSDAKIERMWAGIEAGGRTSTPSRWWLVAVVALLSGLGLVLALRPWSSQAVVAEAEPPQEGRADAWLATGSQAKTYPLGDGSRVRLAPATQVRVDRVGTSEIRLRLERGRIDCDVPAGRRSRLVVRAGPAEMLTTLGRFHVELEMRPKRGPMLRVGVDDGRVAVRRESNGKRLAVLTAGQTWTNAKLIDDAPVSTLPAAPPHRPAAAKVPAPPPSANAGATDPAELLAAAERHRRAGKPAAAAAEYDRLRREHPGDARAGLAAFELARVRLEQLGDARGALEAFDAALASGKGGFFVEDAASGRVRALSKLGSSARCSEARAAFLKAHPKSPHSAQVRGLCKAP